MRCWCQRKTDCRCTTVVIEAIIAASLNLLVRRPTDAQSKNLSDATAKIIDEEVRKLADDAETECRNILKENLETASWKLEDELDE